MAQENTRPDPTVDAVSAWSTRQLVVQTKPATKRRAYHRVVSTLLPLHSLSELSEISGAQTLRDPDLPTEGDLLQWIKKSTKTRSNVFSHGYQGHVYLYDHEGRRLIVKAPTGWGPIRLIYRAMLRNECKVYSKLAGINGIPRCYGLLERRYLVLEYVDGIPIREAKIRDRDAFFSRLLELIEQLHSAGVAHGDMKKKDNVLVVGGCEPCVIDFGVAVVKKPGFAPINRYLYRIAKRFDLNAWVKLKTGFKTGALIEREDELYERTGVETFARWVKRRYVKLKKGLIAYSKKYY